MIRLAICVCGKAHVREASVVICGCGRATPTVAYLAESELPVLIEQYEFQKAGRELLATGPQAVAHADGATLNAYGAGRVAAADVSTSGSGDEKQG